MPATITRDRFNRPGGTAFPYWELFTATAAALGTTGVLNNISSAIRFSIIANGGETIKIQGSKNKVNWTDLKPINEATGNFVTSTALVTGNYRLPYKAGAQWRFFNFVKSAAVASGTALIVVVLPRGTTAGTRNA